MYMSVCVHMYVPVYVYICMCRCKFLCVCVYVHAHVCDCVSFFLRVPVSLFMCLYWAASFPGIFCQSFG